MGLNQVNTVVVERHELSLQRNCLEKSMEKLGGFGTNQHLMYSLIFHIYLQLQYWSYFLKTGLYLKSYRFI